MDAVSVAKLQDAANAPVLAELLNRKKNEATKTSAEDKEFIALKSYIFDNGFVISTVAFHIVTLCSNPMVTPATTDWDFADRALIPDMVFTLLKQPGYLEGIWPSLRTIMGSNAGNTAWCSEIGMTIAFFDTIRVLPTLTKMEELE